jgi:hypothetical protein
MKMSEKDRDSFKAKFWLTRSKNLKAERDVLLEQVKTLRQALEPFAKLAEVYSNEALTKHKTQPLLFSVLGEKVVAARLAFSSTSNFKFSGM